MEESGVFRDGEDDQATALQRSIEGPKVTPLVMQIHTSSWSGKNFLKSKLF